MGFGDIGRSNLGSRKRKRLQAKGATTIDLSAGLQGISQLAGNKALLAMIARRKGDPNAKKLEWLDDEEHADLDEQEKALALLRMLLDDADETLKEAQGLKDPDEAFKLLKEHVEDLLTALNAALAADPDYDGELEEELEALARGPNKAGEHRMEGIVQMLQQLRASGEQAHSKLVDQLDAKPTKGTKPPVGVSGELLNELKRELSKLLKQVADDKPSLDKQRKLDLKKAGMGDKLLSQLGPRKQL